MSPANDELLLDHYLTWAGTVPLAEKAAEVERLAANEVLLKLYRVQLREHRVDPRLRLFFEDVAQHIWLSADPTLALNEFLQAKTKRGRPKRNVYEDLLIAVEVTELMNEERSRDMACEQVAQRIGLKFETIRNIYSHSDKREVAAQIDLSKKWRLPTPRAPKRKGRSRKKTPRQPRR